MDAALATRRDTMASAPARRSALEARVVPLAALADKRAQWAALARTSLEPNVFLEPAFALAAARHLPGAAAPHSVAVWHGDDLAGLFPGTLARGPLATWRALTHAYAPLSTPLVDARDAGPAIDAWLDALAAMRPRPAGLLLPLLAEDGAVARTLRARLDARGIAPVRLDPHMRAALVPGDDTGAARAALSANRRQQYSRKERQFARLGPLSVCIANRTDDTPAAFETFLALEDSGWKGARRTALARIPGALAFAREAVAGLSADDGAHVLVLRAGETPLAAIVTLRSGGGVWYWKTAYDERHAKSSPGAIAILHLTDRLLADGGLARLDSCFAPGVTTLDHVWRERIAVADWMVPLVPRDLRFALVLAAERARRTARGLAKAALARLRGD